LLPAFRAVPDEFESAAWADNRTQNADIGRIVSGLRYFFPVPTVAEKIAGLFTSLLAGRV